MNFLVVTLGVVAANLAPVAPGVALGFAALMVVNALAFHFAPFLRSAERRYSPGLFTAVVLMLPVAAGVYRAAATTGVLSWGVVAASILVGAGLMATPVVLPILKDKPCFRQDDRPR